MKTVNPAASLGQLGLEPSKLTVLIASPPKTLDLAAREAIEVTDGSQTARWSVASLRALFRGDQIPPPFGDTPPPEYLPLFEFVEQHVVAYCDQFGDKTDGEFEDVFRQLRRRPDSKPINQMHFCLWQVAALLAGLWPLSSAEFEAIFNRLTRSAGTFRMGPVSRNYIAGLRGGLR